MGARPVASRCSAHSTVGVTAQSSRASRRRSSASRSMVGRMPRLAATSESVVRRPSIGLLERAIAGSTGTTLAGSARKGATSAAKTSRSAWLAGRAPSIKQAPDVLERSTLGQLDRRVLAVVVEALVAADVAHLGVGHDHALQPSGHLRRTDLGHPHEVAERHDADQLAAPDHRHVAVAALPHPSEGDARVEVELDGVDRVGHDVADREVAEVLGRGDPDDVALGHDADGAGAVARPRPSPPAGRACAAPRPGAVRPPVR